ncbi:RNA 2'-phosphotransferase [Candidatus Methanodesulfokora washburnensis]|nr:RNA 2'-phosphotransferase [Candidatus Methanodesulfokores washburnensis]
MKNSRMERLSKLLSYILRHNPSSVGMTLDNKGFSSITVEELARRIATRRGYEWVRPEHIVEVVEIDEKGRFEIKDGRIRATYGHSIDVEAGTPTKDVEILYHGTTLRAWKMIRDQGIKPGKRRYAHLSSSIEDALSMARRHGRDVVILKIDAKAMINDGFEVRKAGKGIYLVKEVPPKYIVGIVDLFNNNKLLKPQ